MEFFELLIAKELEAKAVLSDVGEIPVKVLPARSTWYHMAFATTSVIIFNKAFSHVI